VNTKAPHIIKRVVTASSLLILLLGFAIVLGISMGSTDSGFKDIFRNWLGIKESDSMLYTIIWQIRFPRVLLAALVGAALSLGGLVFQALLRNPLAEPYILGISGGSAIGAIIGILMGLSRFPGVTLTAFTGSIATLLLILAMSSGQTILKKDALLLSGVMVNAFCAAVIMFLVSITQDSRLHNIIFPFLGRYETCRNSCRNTPPLFFSCFLAFQPNESASHGKGNGTDTWRKHKSGNIYATGSDVIYGERNRFVLWPCGICRSCHAAHASACFWPGSSGSGPGMCIWRRYLYGIL